MHPFHHTIVSEPARSWLRTGSPFIDARTMIKYNDKLLPGKVMCWLPKADEVETDENENDLYKVYEDDGDYGDLELDELKQAIEVFGMHDHREQESEQEAPSLLLLT